MNINDDFTQPVIVKSTSNPWVDTRMSGVKRRMLDRLGAESGRATTIVKYDPDSHFSNHIHTGGEEFLVLEGTFEDEHGKYPAGSYIRNPPQSQHSPSSDAGCTIFVKLEQFDLEDRQHVNIRYDQLALTEQSPGIKSSVLFKDSREKVELLQISAGQQFVGDASQGLEILVLSGSLQYRSEQLVMHDWLRLPVNSTFKVNASAQGATIWMKSGHLFFV